MCAHIHVCIYTKRVIFVTSCQQKVNSKLNLTSLRVKACAFGKMHKLKKNDNDDEDEKII